MPPWDGPGCRLGRLADEQDPGQAIRTEYEKFHKQYRSLVSSVTQHGVRADELRQAQQVLDERNKLLTKARAARHESLKKSVDKARVATNTSVTAVEEKLVEALSLCKGAGRSLDVERQETDKMAAEVGSPQVGL